jgi:Putative DNA-binding domain
MNTYIKADWKEAEILALPAGEHNYFERKGAGLLADKDFFNDLAKALSAFSNSGGGHIIIGQEDDCSITGIDKIYAGKRGKSRQTIREWFEDIIPNLLNYPLRDFRVHEVKIKSLPKGKIIIVIDVGDSKLAPHQTNIKKEKKELNAYYQRFGGKSLPAEHHNISLLFGRSRFPSKEVAESWRNFVVNPLINYLRNETKNLQRKRRLWQFKERIFFTQSAPISFLFTDGHNLCDLDVLNQFLEFNPRLGELLEKHDETIKTIDRQCQDLYCEIKKLGDLQKYYKSVTTKEHIKEIGSFYSHLQHLNVEELYNKMFTMGSEKKVLEFITILMVNRHSDWKGNDFGAFWKMESPKFNAFLKQPPLLPFDKAIDKSYRSCSLINLRMIKDLEGIRNALSQEYGIPVK